MLSNILYSVIWNKCPKCNKGDVFITNNAYDLKRFDKMHETCSCCAERFEKEPGYFYGAMYVSYALMVGWFVITWSINTFVIDVSTGYYLAFLISTTILFVPLTFRISRLLWMNFFVKFDKNKRNCKKTENNFIPKI